MNATGAAPTMIANQRMGQTPSDPTTSNNTFVKPSMSAQSTTFQQQLRLPVLPSSQGTAQTGDIPPDSFLFATDGELAQDLAPAGMSMNWVLWDCIMQDIEGEE